MNGAWCGGSNLLLCCQEVLKGVVDPVTNQRLFKQMGLPIRCRALNVTLRPLVQGHVTVTHRQPLRLGSAAGSHLWLASSAGRFWRMKKNFLDSDDI